MNFLFDWRCRLRNLNTFVFFKEIQNILFRYSAFPTGSRNAIQLLLGYTFLLSNISYQRRIES
ncbi:Uncharacterised protein [Mycobacterium tuberculosis]|nr:Uncharacterised protein [Mycobacterium tuberculosis]